jgi:hypothetical protein
VKKNQNLEMTTMASVKRTCQCLPQKSKSWI